MMTMATPITPSPASAFRLASDEVHIWCVRLDLDVAPETFARLYATLTPDEQTRSARFRFERDQQRFIVARGALRELLGCYLQIPPSQIRCAYSAFGKPELSPEFDNRVQFNLSHSAGLAVIAITATSSVGVDLERISAQSDYADIARHFFSAAEVDGLVALPSHLFAEAFLGCWTKKEAYLKACGEGLTIPLNRLSVPPNTDSTSSRWSLRGLRPAPGYIGALAIEGTGWRVRQRPWSIGYGA